LSSATTLPSDVRKIEKRLAEDRALEQLIRADLVIPGGDVPGVADERGAIHEENLSHTRSTWKLLPRAWFDGRDPMFRRQVEAVERSPRPEA
jgi:hypothetical protein